MSKGYAGRRRDIPLDIETPLVKVGIFFHLSVFEQVRKPSPGRTSSLYQMSAVLVK
jgi:hypothetical protein